MVATPHSEPGADRAVLADRQKLLQLLPGYCLHYLLAGADILQIGLYLKMRPGLTVHALVFKEQERLLADRMLHGGFSPEALGDAAWQGHFDCVVLDYACMELLAPMRDALVQCLSPYAKMIAIVPNTGHWASAASACDSYDAAIAKAAAAGFSLFDYRILEDPDFPAFEEEEKTVLHRGKSYPVEDRRAHERLRAIAWIMTFVLPAYNPMEHADYLLSIRLPGHAFGVLEAIPPAYLQNDLVHINVNSALAVTILDQVKQGMIAVENAYNAYGRVYLYKILSLDPSNSFAYQCMAEFWSLLGDKSMAVRTLRLMAQVTGERALLHRLPKQPAVLPLADRLAAPPMDAAAPPEFRVLLITHSRPHYGLDVLFDGLCEVLGADRINEYPWKPIMHGFKPEKLAHYPCSFDHPGEALPFQTILDRLREGYYACVLYGDVEKNLPEAEATALGQAASNTPLFVVDALDDFVNTRDWFSVYPGFPTPAGYIKREMLHCVDYGPNTFSMPFGYDRRRGIERFSRERSRGLFWAGHRQYGMRRPCIEAVERHLDLRLDTVYPPEEYVSSMRQSRIGLNLIGLGYDTVRYWELPANGCMILSERLPFYIPYDFEDGVSAVFFEDLDDLTEKLDYYLEHVDASLDIAERGHEHYLRFHTNGARARQVLSWVLRRIDALRADPA
ncbi:MAG: glycosyltransferase family 1 protein [Candidatus Hydrogenedentes bacterium]|nr:glycosyltransferase family 1 protein [Candidatus Hydrogenedentota bacterium]